MSRKRICIDTRTLPAPKDAGDPVSGKYCSHRRHSKKCGSCKDISDLSSRGGREIKEQALGETEIKTQEAAHI